MQEEVATLVAEARRLLHMIASNRWFGRMVRTGLLLMRAVWWQVLGGHGLLQLEGPDRLGGKVRLGLPKLS